ncbi:unnamed protein product [Caenorhabditis auriculariae]|uniref:non-specific serine/threonine protein kinase n=1 Tax=Caenorhabditis auriculariae TaxID=2777116 RepID=A0A8S1GRG2_9PELO|nr:unnamed protein product [Caenorhabditis auriculariae]
MEDRSLTSTENRRFDRSDNACSTANFSGFMENSKTENKKLVGVMPRIKRTNSETPLLVVDEVYRKRWHIQGVIGKGGYGEIFLAIDVKRAEEVAIKAEPKHRRGKLSKRMILEQKVLLKLQGKPHVPVVYASGHDERLNFIVMQILSVNVGDLKRQSPVKRLSRTTVGRILQQSIAALRDLHGAGYLHRDVKPANMCFGVTQKTRHVLMLLDFGLIRRFKEENGDLRPPRKKAGFRGTQRYVSTRVHARLEQTPCDDLVSLLYSGYELLIGELPWKFLEKNDEIRRFKEDMQTPESDFLSHKGDPFHEFGRHVFFLDPFAEPPYHDLQNTLKALVGGKKLVDPYDWEDNYQEVLDESTSSKE